MPLLVPDGSFEVGDAWSFTDMAGISPSPPVQPFLVQTAIDGLFYGYMNLMNTSTARAGGMSIRIPVGLDTEGYYQLQFRLAANHVPLHLFGDGANFFSVYLDGNPWATNLNIYAGEPYLSWGTTTLGTRAFAAGTHELALVAENEPLSDYSGTPWDSFLSLALVDALVLLPAPGPPFHHAIRLTHAPGTGLKRFTVPSGMTGRVVHHS